VRIASLVALPVEFVARVFHPLVWALNGLGGLTVRLFGLSPQGESHHQVLPAEELDALIQSSARAGTLRSNPLALRRSLRFSDLQARDLIVPRQDIVALDITMSIDAVLDIARESRHTRYPVYERTIDTIVGVLNIKDLIQVNPDGMTTLIRAWQRLVRPLPVLPENVAIERVLQRLGQEKQQMALLIDEYGGTAGILTVTDIASAIIAETEEIRQMPDGRYVVAGDASIDMVEEIMDISLGDNERDYDTIGGLVMTKLGRVPNVGDQIVVYNTELRVAAMRGRRVTQVVIRYLPSPQPAEP
jgi:putative hemolysin